MHITVTCRFGKSFLVTGRPSCDDNPAVVVSVVSDVEQDDQGLELNMPTGRRIVVTSTVRRLVTNLECLGCLSSIHSGDPGYSTPSPVGLLNPSPGAAGKILDERWLGLGEVHKTWSR